jgi:hypothetical protein
MALTQNDRDLIAACEKVSNEASRLNPQTVVADANQKKSDYPDADERDIWIIIEEVRREQEELVMTLLARVREHG